MQVHSDGVVDYGNAMPTLEDQLNSVGLGRLQWIVVLAAGIMVLGDGMEMAAVSMLERPLAREWGVSSDELAVVGSILFAGTIVGALWGGWCSDRFGRRWTLVSFGLLFIFGGISSVASQSFMIFAATRFVTGMGIGAAQGSAISLIAELSPTMHRGKLSMLVGGVGQAAGMGAAALLGIICRSLDIGQSWWRTMLLLCIAPTVVGVFLLQNFVPESPHYCLVNGRKKEAEDLIRQLAKENGHEHKLINGGKIYYVPPTEEENKLSDLLDPDLREPIAFICSAFIASCFAFHGHSFIYAIILQDVYHEEVQAEYYALAFASCTQIVAVVISAQMLDDPRFGRRRTMQVLYAGGFALCVAAAFLDELGAFKMANALLRALLQASLSCVYVFGAELLPTTHRVLGLAVCNGAGRLAAMAAPVVTAAALHMSTGWVYASFMAATALGGVATLAFQRETYGEYLAGFTHEACEIGSSARRDPASTRRNIESSPFHDQFEGLPAPARSPRKHQPFLRTESVGGGPDSPAREVLDPLLSTRSAP